MINFENFTFVREPLEVDAHLKHFFMPYACLPQHIRDDMWWEYQSIAVKRILMSLQLLHVILIMFSRQQNCKLYYSQIFRSNMSIKRIKQYLSLDKLFSPDEVWLLCSIFSFWYMILGKSFYLIYMVIYFYILVWRWNPLFFLLPSFCHIFLSLGVWL